MKNATLAAALLLAACATAPAEAQQTPGCPPAGYNRAQLDALKASEWAIADDAARNALARSLTACLGSPDPTLRDGIVFEALQYWMRQQQLSNETLAALQDTLEANLAAPDPQGFRSSFSALVFADVVRTDRVSPWMTPERRARALNASVNFLTNLRDYRGFDAREGYRHAPAHASDLMLQLVLNTAYGKPELVRVRDAIASQIAPAGHFYIYGESERLARPILYMAQRNVFSEAEWTEWFTQVAGPGPLGRWEGWFQSQAGLERRHNLMMFTGVMYANVGLSQNPALATLRPGVEAAVQALP